MFCHRSLTPNHHPLPRFSLVEIGTTAAETFAPEKRSGSKSSRKEHKGDKRRDGKHSKHGTDRKSPSKRVRTSSGGSDYDSGTDVDETRESNFKIVKKFQPLLFLGCSGDRTLVAVERPWLAVMQQLPPPLFRAKYGAV